MRNLLGEWRSIIYQGSEVYTGSRWWKTLAMNREDIQIGTKVYIHTYSGWTRFQVTQPGWAALIWKDGTICNDFNAILDYDTDDRHCWVCYSLVQGSGNDNLDIWYGQQEEETEDRKDWPEIGF